MATNMKRAANRKASFHTGSSGSPFHTERNGSGPVAGAGEVYTGGPGKAARSYRGNDNVGTQGNADGKPPKGMKTIVNDDK